MDLRYRLMSRLRGVTEDIKGKWDVWEKVRQKILHSLREEKMTTFLVSRSWLS